MKPLMRLHLILAGMLIATVVLSGGQLGHAQTPHSTAQAMLYRYYNAINLRDFATAYNLWGNPVQTYESFSSGFADTALVQPYFGTYQVNSFALGTPPRIPAVLLAYQIHGAVVSYFGCFTVALDSFSQWRIMDGDFRLLSNTQVPDVATIRSLLEIDCFHIPTTVAATYRPQLFTSAGQGALLAYYNAINTRDYASAYAMWLHPLPGPKPNGAPAQDYRPNYAEYVVGYGDTVFVNLYMGDYVETGASAGHGYLNGLLPAVLVGQHTDGSFVAYYGCYVMGILTNPPGAFGIVSGTFLPLVEGAPLGQLILQYLNFDCTTLSLRY